MKKMVTMTTTAGVFAALLSGAAWAGPKCTDEPQEKWKPPVEVLSAAMKEVTKLKVFKVTDGNCYEVYGWSSAGEKLEIYYHPITGEVAKRGSW